MKKKVRPIEYKSIEDMYNGMLTGEQEYSDIEKYALYKEFGNETECKKLEPVLTKYIPKIDMDIKEYVAFQKPNYCWQIEEIPLAAYMALGELVYSVAEHLLPIAIKYNSVTYVYSELWHNFSIVDRPQNLPDYVKLIVATKLQGFAPDCITEGTILFTKGVADMDNLYHQLTESKIVIGYFENTDNLESYKINVKDHEKLIAMLEIRNNNLYNILLESADDASSKAIDMCLLDEHKRQVVENSSVLCKN